MALGVGWRGRLLAVADQLQPQQEIEDLQRVEAQQLALADDVVQRGGVGHQGKDMGFVRLQGDGGEACGRRRVEHHVRPRTGSR